MEKVARQEDADERTSSAAWMGPEAHQCGELVSYEEPPPREMFALCRSCSFGRKVRLCPIKRRALDRLDRKRQPPASTYPPQTADSTRLTGTVRTES